MCLNAKHPACYFLGKLTQRRLHMTVIIERPRWAKRDLALKLTGVSECALLKLVNEGLVRARKMDARKKSGCVFCVPDIEEWLENEAPHAGPFVLPNEPKKQDGVV